ncbi:diguanylate cyclase [Caloramator sp. E03]|uniref:sensor domain-containing diguanylate cyclase n=1 Tax=Caloramator sp. E03 TaxID=2576307 RepID=UPI001110C427|nr:sensor domain-containing diguanylate cyclase [Caloramator sp. E03]QCX33347.1 diguanylate cyclase [Caloramator sp. E03]
MSKTKQTLIILIIVFSSYFYFNLKKVSTINNLISSALSTRNRINQYIKLSCDSINTLSIYGNEYINGKKYNISPYFKDLKYDKDSNSYNLDNAFKNGYSKYVGNLTGKGNIPKDPLLLKELNLALSYNKYFRSIYNSLPGIAWIYYTSKNGFINIYPWVSSKEFSYSDILLKKEFFTGALPNANKDKASFWTPVYYDAAGKGNMITISSPIYYNNDFLGVVSIDITINKINDILKSSYNSFLINKYDQIIGANFNKNLIENKITHLNEFFKGYNENQISALKTLPENKIIKWENYYVYKQTFSDANCLLYCMIPKKKVLFDAFVSIIPILIIGTLLLILSYVINIQKKTQRELKTLVDELAATQSLLHQSASHDFLTSVLNRRGFYEKFKELLSKIDENDPISIIAADVDFFKKVNDLYGHDAGDYVLKKIANTIINLIDKNDIFSRWGGEEFLIVLPNTSYEEALKKAETLRNEIENNVIKHKNKKIKITMTFGVSRFNSIYGIDKCISNADKALYHGKNKGRNCVVGFESILD